LNGGSTLDHLARLLATNFTNGSNDLVGECERRRRHLEAKRPCALEVDHELELGRLLDCELGDDLRAVTF
jgi:hypothetical protein